MVDERFAFITDKDGNKYQSLLYDEEGNPIDWDEQETAKLVQNITV